MVVWHMTEGYAPAACRPLEYRVTGIWRPGLHLVKNRLGVCVSWATDTAGIDHKASVAEACDTRDVCMSAEEESISASTALSAIQLP